MAVRAMRRERRGGDADAEAPQAFKEGASTMRNAQNRTHISCSAAAWGGVMVGIGLQCCEQYNINKLWWT